MVRFLALAILLLLAGPARADLYGFMTTHCASLDEKRDGVRCTTTSTEGYGPTLRILITAHPLSAKAQRDRTNYVIDTALNAFHGRGGRHSVWRRTNTDGSLIERHCTRPRGGRTERCADWYPATPAKW